MSRELDKSMYTDIRLAKEELDKKYWGKATNLFDKTYNKCHQIFSEDMEACPFYAPNCGEKGCPVWECPHHKK